MVRIPAVRSHLSEDRSSGHDLLHQGFILNEWFEHGRYLCLKSRLPLKLLIILGS
jgi:hypothetical protein